MMPMNDFERDSLRAAWEAKKIWAMQFIGNAAIMLATYGWLQIPDAHAWQLVITAVIAVMLLGAFSWLQSFTLAHFHRDVAISSGKGSAVVRAILFLVLLVVFLAIESMITRAEPYVPQTAGYTQHVLPGVARAHTTPQSIDRKMQFFVAALEYFVIPVLLLPLISSVSAKGLRGFNPSTWIRRTIHWRWLIFFALSLALGWFLPVYLASAGSKAGGVAAQVTNLVLRLAAAYFIVVTVWLCVASALGRLLQESPSDPASGA